MAIFKGFVKLSQKNYELLKKTGKLTIGDKTITYEPKTTFYITPYVPPVAGAGGGNSDVDLSEYVKFTDFAGNSKPGVVDVRAFFGMIVDDYGRIQTVKATDDEIKAKTNEYHPLVSKNIDLIVKTGLTTNALEWSDDDKKAARTLIGATNLNTHINYGIQNNNTGLMMIVRATNNEILNRSTTYKPIVPTNLDYAVAQGLIGKKIETTNEDGTVTTTYEHSVELSADEQRSARELLDSVGNTDYAQDKGSAGIVYTDRSTYGVGASTNGLLFIDGASKPQILDKGSAFKPITTNNIDYAVKVGMTTNTETWSETEKTAARTLIDAVGNTDYATVDKAGIVRINNYSGIRIDNEHKLFLDNANADEIKNKSSYNALKIDQIDTGVLSGLAYSKLEWTDEEKANARTLINAVSQNEIDTAIAGLGTVFDLKGTKPTATDLPTTDNQIGDVWYVVDEAVGYIWLNDGNSDKWEKFGAPIDLSGYAEITDLNSYLPLSAGSTKPLTDILYADSGVRVGSSNYLSFVNEAKFITPSKVIRFGSSSGNNSDLLVMTQSYLRPNGNNTALGNSSNQWKEIYGIDIYQNGNKVLDVSGGTLSGPLVITGGDAATGVGNIQLDTNGQITAKGTTATLFGRNSVGSLLLGHSSHALSIRGSATRPTYNGTNIALSSDIPTNNNQLTNGAGYSSSTRIMSTTLSTAGQNASFSSPLQAGDIIRIGMKFSNGSNGIVVCTYYYGGESSVNYYPSETHCGDKIVCQSGTVNITSTKITLVNTGYTNIQSGSTTTKITGGVQVRFVDRIRT